MAFVKKERSAEQKDFDDNTCVKGISFEVYADKKHDQVLNKIFADIKKYRVVAQQIASFLFMANSIKPLVDTESEDFKLKYKFDREGDNKLTDDINEILNYFFHSETDTLGYQLRPKIISENPDWKSVVWDSLRSVVASTIKAKHPERKIPRITLLGNGEATIPKFSNIGIDLPSKAHVKIDKHSIILSWNKTLGPIEFRFSRLDASRYHIWKNLVAKTKYWKLGTVRLNYRDTDKGRQLYISTGYYCPIKRFDFDKDAVFQISFNNDEENFIKMDRPDKDFSADKISAKETLGHIDEIKARSQYFKKRLAAVGFGAEHNKRPRFGSGRKMFDAVAEKMQRLTLHRLNVVKEKNQYWVDRIIKEAKKQRCGKLVFLNTLEETLFNRSWQWFQFNTMIKNKCKEYGMKVEGLRDTTEKKVKVKTKAVDKEVACSEECVSV